jgi:hypothetical protein
MYPPYQVPASLTPIAAKLNVDLANIQNGANIIGRTNAMTQAYTSIIAGYSGDPNRGQMIPGTELNYDDATQVQRLIFMAYQLAGIASNPAGASVESGVPTDIASILAANPGPTGDGEWWNWSYAAWGLVPGKSMDASVKMGTVLQVNGNSVTPVTGVLAV